MPKKRIAITGLTPGQTYNAKVKALSAVPAVAADVKVVKIKVLEAPKPTPPRRSRDPLAQTFELPEVDAYLTRLELKFASAPPAPADATSEDPPVTVEIREVEDGTPTDRLVGDGVSVSGNAVRSAIASASGVVSFEFATPVVLKAKQRYALVVKTPSPLYRVYVAELGQLELNTSTRVTTQPYPEGTLLQSSDLSSWDALPGKDLWFKLYFAEYPTTSETFEFDPILVGRANVVGFRLNALFGLLQESGAVTQISWEYRTAALEDASSPWSNYKGVQPYANLYLEAAFSRIQFRATLRGGGTTSKRISPYLERNSLRVDFFQREAASRLVSKQLTLAAPYRTIRMAAKLWVPSSAARIDWYFSEGKQATEPVDYNAGSSYAADALVRYQSTIYVAKEAVTAGQTPGPSSAVWNEVEILNNLVWRLVPATGETKLAVSGMEAGWYEHERQVTLPADSTRTKFFYMFKLSSQNVAQAPALKDVVCILNG